MRYRTLGKTDIQLSAVTFGCWELGGGPWEFTNDESNIKAIQAAYEAGIHTFDTAEGYGNGHSEEIVGRALAGIRDRCVIATKVSRANLAPADVRRSAEASLKRLNSDYIDIYYIHWPSHDIPVGETLREFNRLKEEKLIRAIGVSNFSLAQLQEAAEYARIDLIQPEYSLLHREIEQGIVPYCLEHGISVTSYSSIAKGILTGAFHLYGKTLKEDDFRAKRRLFLPEHLELEKELIDVLKDVAEAHGKTLTQIAVAWVLAQPALTSAIVGTQNAAHVAENAAAAEIELTAAELERLDRASRNALAGIDGSGR